MPQFIALVIHPATEADYPPPPLDAVEQMSAFNQRLVEAGIMVGGNGLLPPRTGARLSFPGGSKAVIEDGPFAEAKEVVGGYWMLQHDSQAELVAVLAECPLHDGGIIELRQIMSMEDHTPEVQAAAKLEGLPLS